MPGRGSVTAAARRRPARVVLVGIALATTLVGAAPAGVAATGRPVAARVVAVNAAAPPATLNVAATPFRIDLADGNDFVAQRNFVQCVGASMQMMLNILGADDRSAATQLRLQQLARGLSGATRDGFERKGASVRGWSAGMNELGAGPYKLVGAATVDEALALAANAIRETGRPVGLLMWAGRHAWVMSGFEATADPGRTERFAVTRAIVLDPLYPYGSARWGASPWPHQALTAAALGQQFVPRRQGAWPGALVGGPGATEMAALAGTYVLVLPYVERLVARGRPLAV